MPRLVSAADFAAPSRGLLEGGSNVNLLFDRLSQNNSVLTVCPLRLGGPVRNYLFDELVLPVLV